MNATTRSPPSCSCIIVRLCGVQEHEDRVLRSVAVNDSTGEMDTLTVWLTHQTKQSWRELIAAFEVQQQSHGVVGWSVGAEGGELGCAEGGELRCAEGVELRCSGPLWRVFPLLATAFPIHKQLLLVAQTNR